MNIILKPFNCCPECLSTELTTDLNKMETFCSNCGLVLVTTYPESTAEAIYNNRKEKEVLQQLKQDKKLKKIIESYEKQQQELLQGRKKNRRN